MKAIISLASNCGDKESNIRHTIEEISNFCSILQYSGEYLTDATDGSSAPYLNAVASIESNLGIEDLNYLFKKIEVKLGRDEESRRMKRVPCDIDIVEADGKILRPKDASQPYYIMGIHRLTRQNRNIPIAK